MTRAIDRWFLRYRRTGDVRLLGNVFDHTAPELWRLAAHLCADRHDAEDAVQTTFLAAIENRDDWDETRPLVPWLLGVLANRVREQRRRENRVVDAARTEPMAPLPDPSVVAAQRELDARLAASLQALGEPYTTTLRRHLFEGLAAVDLARELGVPAGTVRMRLHRGLERLRELLPAGLGTTAMAGAIVPLVLTDSAKAAMREQVLAKAVALGGTARVGSLVVWPWLLAALLPIVLVGATWAFAPSTVVPSPPVLASADVPSVSQETGSVAASPPSDASVVSQAQPSEGERRRVEVTSARSTVAGTLRVTVVHGATKEPLAGMRVTASRDEEPQTRSESTSRPIVETDGEQPGAPAAKRVSHRDDRAPTFASGQTDAEGRVDLMIAAGPVRVAATIGTNVSSRVEVVGGAVTEHTHAVPVLFTAEVQVVAADGAPCEGATLLGMGVGDREFEPVGVTDREGRWRSPRLDPQLQVRAVRDGCAASRLEKVTIGREQVRLVLGGPAPRLHGVVRDQAGAAVPNARILLWQDASFDVVELRADAAGSFESSWFAPGRYQWLAGDSERKLAPGRGALEIAFGMLAVELQAARGARIVAHVRTADNSAIARIGVRAETLRDEHLGHPLWPWRVRDARVNERGRAELSGLMAGAIQVTAEWGGRKYSETIEVADGGVGEVTFVCGEGEKLIVEVVDEHDLAFAGIGVALWVGDNQQIQTTDARGRVEFTGVTAGQHEVAVGPAGMQGLAWVRHSVSTGESQRLVVPRSVGSECVRGRLAGDGLRGEVDVACFRAGVGAFGERSSGTFDAATGTFVVEQLPAGTIHAAVFSRARMELLAVRTVEVPEGGDVDLGTIVCGSGELVVRLHSDGPLRSPLVGPGMTSQLELVPTTRAGGWKRPLPEGTWQVLAWAENAQPAIVSAVIKIGVTTELDVTLVPGTPTTFLMVLDPMLEFTLADGRQFGCMVAQTKSLTLGLPPGRHRVINRGLNGERVEATFDVGSEPGTVDLTKLPTTR